MFNKKKLNLDKYKEILNKIIVDEEICEDIIEKINFYLEYGKIYLDGKDLYGKYENKKDLNRAIPAVEFLEIKARDELFICNYSEWSNRKVVNIVQKSLKGGNTSIYKKETDYTLTYNNENSTSSEEKEKIFNYQKRLVFDSKLEKEYDFDTYSKDDSNIIYNKEDFSNKFSLEKNWYISNGSIIKYTLSKSFLSNSFAGSDEIEEHYSICPGVIVNEFGRYFNYQELEKELFKKFMSGEINIDEVLQNVKSKKLKFNNTTYL